jgi:hypothetical protein
MTDTTTTDTPAPAFDPVPIPSGDVVVPPSVWAPGDVHHTHDQIVAESPAGVLAANAPDPRDAEIMRLNALLAGQAAPDSKDQEIAALKARLTAPAPAAAPAGPVEAVATTVDPRDAELEALQAEVTAREAADAEAAAAASNPAHVEPIAPTA